LSQPSAKQNTIWVKTDRRITAWTFSAYEPQGVDEGTVWFLVNTASGIAFNAVKKNTLMVYPVSCKQYLGGTFVAQEAHIFIGSQWTQFSSIISDVYLFNNGDQCTDITGGWGCEGVIIVDEDLSQGRPGAAGAKLSVDVDYSYSCSVIGTVNKIDLTDAHTLYVDASHVRGKAFVILTEDNEVESEGRGEQLSGLLSLGVNTFDVSHLVGSYHVCIYAYMKSYGGGDYPEAEVTQVWYSGASGGGSSGGEEGISLLSLDGDPDDNVVSVEVDGTTYGVNNATVNQEPTPITYDFTVK
jgi:hypothetical protein